MKHTIWTIPATLALLALFASADSVYMMDGTVHHGRVARQGGQYVISSGSGVPVVVESANVDKIIPDSSEGPSSPPPGTATTAPAAVPAPAPATPVAPAPAPAPSALFGPGVTPSVPPVPAAAAGGTPSTSVRWSITEATLPEPIVFMLCRQIELGGQEASAGLGQSLNQYRSYAHEGRRKISNDWATRVELTRMRAEFQKHLDLATRLAQSAGRAAPGRGGNYGTGAAAQAAQDREIQRTRDLAEAFGELLLAARVFPDMDMRDLLQGDLELRKSNWQPAELRFRRLASQAPLVAAYHQGRAMALIGLKLPMDALDEAMLTVQLRTDSLTAFQLLQKAMQAMPGSELQNPKYQAAKALLDRYEMPKPPAKASTAGIEWLMPGKSWTNPNDTLPVPPYDCIVAKQALAVPIGEDRLLMDAEELANAEIIYVELAPGQYVRADQVKATGAAAAPTDVPLAILRVTDARFTPVAINPAALVAGKPAAARAVNLYRQMGDEIRTWQAVLAPDGLKLVKGTLPGETTGVIFADEAVANFVLGRTDVEDPQCGQSAIILPAALQTFVAPLMKAGPRSVYSGSYSSGGPKLKVAAAPAPSKGKAFVVHILCGVAPETPAGR